MLLNDVQKLHQKFTSLYYLYAKALPIKPENLSSIPRFTPLFRAIPQYHQIYDCAIAWFSKGVFTIREEQFIQCNEKRRCLQIADSGVHTYQALFTG